MNTKKKCFDILEQIQKLEFCPNEPTNQNHL